MAMAAGASDSAQSKVEPVEEFQDEEDEEEQVEGWDDWETDEDESESSYLCLFCEARFPSSDDLFAHCRAEHSFDFHAIRRDLKLDFYGCLKLINYVRAQVRKSAASVFRIFIRSEIEFNLPTAPVCIFYILEMFTVVVEILMRFMI